MSGNTHSDILLVSAIHLLVYVSIVMVRSLRGAYGKWAAGALAAFAVDLLVYPLDTLKTRIQSPDYKKIYYNASKNAVNKPLLLRGLYQGVGSVILITIPSSGAFFTTYEGVKTILNKANPALSGSSHSLIPQPFIDSAASSIAELVSCFILTPAEVLKQNAQMVRRPQQSAITGSTAFQPSVTLEVLKHFKRPSQLFRGYTALVARNLPFTAMQFPIFEHLKRTIKGYRQRKGTATGTLTETGMITAFSAGSAGSVAAVITTPFDVIKTRIMLSAAEESSAVDVKKIAAEAKAKGQTAGTSNSEREIGRKSGLMVAKEVIRENGLKGLFRGATLRGTWTAVGSGLYLGVYESCRVYLGDRRKKEDL